MKIIKSGASSIYLLIYLIVFFVMFFFYFFIFVEHYLVAQSGVKDASPSSVVVVAPVAATEDEDEDDATINKWSKFRVKALKFNENTYFRYIVLIVIIIGSIAMVSGLTQFPITFPHSLSLSLAPSVPVYLFIFYFF